MKMEIWCILILCSLLVNGKTYPRSPCPKIFTYKQVSGLWLGHVSLQADFEDLPLKLSIHLKIPAALRSKYVGLLELEQSPDSTLRRILSTSNGTRVNYTVRFPLPSPLPFIQTIIMNNVTICKGNEEFGTVITNIYLEHQFPTNPIYSSLISGPDDFNRLHSVETCGRSYSPFDFEQERIVTEGDWPWLVGIFLKKRGLLHFHCSGSLVSLKHVLTAAHCTLDENDDPYIPDSLVTYLGKYDLTKWGEPGSQVRGVQRIKIHPEFSRNDYQADLGVLELSQDADEGKRVRPICLWRGSTSLERLVGRLGTIGGWGREIKGMKREPRLVHLPVVAQEDCLRSRKDFLYITSRRTFCAGFRNGTGPCHGESGGGLMIENRGVWSIRGVLSLSLLDRSLQTCDLSNYVVFTDAAQFSSWIYSLINQNLTRKKSPQYIIN